MKRPITPNLPKPRDEPLLRKIIENLFATFIGIVRKEPGYPSNDFAQITLSPWTGSGQPGSGQDKKIRLLEAVGADGKKLVRQLENLRAEDPHLTLCCPDTWGFCRALDTLLFNYLLPTAMVYGQDRDKELLSSELDKVVRALYSAQYQRIGLFHLYNFDSDANPLNLAGVTVVKVDKLGMAQIFGEKSHISFFYREHCGSYFLTVGDTGTSDDVGWLSRQWEDSETFETALQYFKDGVIEIDFAGLYYLPEWINQVRKFGLFFLGNPRQDTQRSRYFLSQSEETGFDKFCSLAIDAQTQIEREAERGISTLAKAIDTAGSFYKNYHTRGNREDKLIDLVVCLEALFAGRQFSNRIQRCQFATLLLAIDPVKRVAIYDRLSKAYRYRNKLVHEGVAEFDDSDVAETAKIVRRLLVAVATRYMRGLRDKADFLKDLRRAILDPACAERIANDADPDKYIQEQSGLP